jgi:hypothetical protein
VGNPWGEKHVSGFGYEANHMNHSAWFVDAKRRIKIGARESSDLGCDRQGWGAQERQFSRDGVLWSNNRTPEGCRARPHQGIAELLSHFYGSSYPKTNFHSSH